MSGLLVLILLGMGVTPAGPKHGTWVYSDHRRSVLDTDPEARSLLAFARAQGLTEVYLSAGAVPLDDPRTPSWIARLHAGGLRVEALVEGTGAPKAVKRAVRYHREQPAASGLDGIHYDEEPWQGQGNDTEWVAPFAQRLREARKALEGTELSFAVDVSAVKLAHLSREQRAQLEDAAGTLVLMAYEAPERVVASRVDDILSQAGNAHYVVATRVKDFGAKGFARCQQGAVLERLDARYRKNPRFAGWATFSYNDHQDAQLCPTGCCASPRAAR